MKIWTGVGLVAAGLLTLPATDTTGTGSSRHLLAGSGMAAAGSVLIWLGARDQRRAASPQTTVAVAVGRRTGLQIRRSW